MAAAAGSPLKLEPSFRERIWGREDLSYLYPHRSAGSPRIGEVWLTADDNVITGGFFAAKTLAQLCSACGPELIGQTRAAASQAAAFPLLIKFIFTSEKLSVQVHPGDEYANRVEGCSGKTEMWHVLKAEPGARLAVGFRQNLSQPPRGALVGAIESGEIEHMLNWTEVQEGDTFFIPAGTVHAIGAGLVICEIQQNCDLTYRLFDYNRKGTDGKPRELHVKKALDVIEWRTRGGKTSPLAYDAAGTRQCLAACDYFTTEKLTLDRPARFATGGGCHILIGMEGDVSLEADGHAIRLSKGEAAIVPAQAASLTISPASSRCVVLRTYQPQLERDVVGPLRDRGFSNQQLARVCFSATLIA